MPAGVGITPGFFTGATPAGGAGMETPAAAALQKIQAQVPMTPEQYQEARTQVGIHCKNMRGPKGGEE